MTTLAVVAIQTGPWPQLAGPTGTALALILTVWALFFLFGGFSIFAWRSSKRRQQSYLAKIQNLQNS